jgi:hypothetical protein
VEKQLLVQNGEGFDVRVHLLDRKAFLSHNNFQFPNQGRESFFSEQIFNSNRSLRK